MTIVEKVKQAMFGHKGEVLLKEQIIKIVKANYSEINEASIIPSDYCDNISNKDPRSGVVSVFTHLDHNKYKVL